MSEEKEDILFQIDMQLYDEFNDTIATMNDHLGDIYSLREVEEVEKAEKEKEIKLLREAIKKLQKEIEIKDKVIDKLAQWIRNLQGCITSKKCIIEIIYKEIENE